MELMRRLLFLLLALATPALAQTSAYDLLLLGGGNAGPALDLNFATGVMDSRVNFTRASSRECFNSAGVLVTLATNVPCLDYNPTTLLPMGLAIEEQRTNLVYPSVPATATWSVSSDTTFAASAAVAPDGTNSAVSVFASDTTSANPRQISNTTAFTVSPSTAYAVSFYLKSSTNNGYIQVNLNLASQGASVAYFNLSNGTGLVGADLAAGPTNKSVAVTPLNAGWYRVTFYLTTTASTTSMVIYTGPCVTVSSTGDNRAYTGVIGQGIYAWGAQVEAGAFATSYIPTTSSTATRATEVVYIPTGPWFNAGAGTAAISFDSNHSGGSTVMGLSDGSFGNSLYISYNALVAVNQNQSFIPSAGNPTIGGGVINEQVMAYGAGRLAIATNGAVSSFATMNNNNAYPWNARLSIGDSPWALDAQVDGHVQRVRYWPYAQTAIQLQGD